MTDIEYQGHIERTTGKAWLVDIQGVDYWLPKSQVKHTNHGQFDTFAIPKWLVSKKELPTSDYNQDDFSLIVLDDNDGRDYEAEAIQQGLA